MSVMFRRLLLASRIGAALAAVFVLGLALMGSGPGLALRSPHAFTPAEITLPPCTDRTPIDVTELAGRPRSTCDPTGIQLILPDGQPHRP